ncbi:MAG: hypothetical protein HY323_08155 [Betaproteobacteria bacterium]|nr:hypothetical protein [Betaproteobacteria bacterium]
MSMTPEDIRRIIREDREDAERRAADKAERDELRARLDKLEAKGSEKRKDDDAADDHPFEA